MKKDWCGSNFSRTDVRPFFSINAISLRVVPVTGSQISGRLPLTRKIATVSTVRSSGLATK